MKSEMCEALSAAKRVGLAGSQAERNKETMTLSFSTAGVGGLLANTFNTAVSNVPDAFPNLAPRGKTLLVAGDFGGMHRGQRFETYAFVVYDLDCNETWLDAQRHFRRHVLRGPRRMAFKAMNDRYRRAALVPLLDLADLIHGWLIVFAISKAGGSCFAQPEGPEADRILTNWKPIVRERLRRILHLSGFLVSGLADAGQNVLWMIDQDDIAANPIQLNNLTMLLGQVISHSISHNLGHIRCGTAHCDDGSLWLEDTLSLCDLAAGAVCETSTKLTVLPSLHQKHIISPIAPQASWKSRVITSWLASQNSPLKRMTCFIELDDQSPQIVATVLRWRSMSGAA